MVNVITYYCLTVMTQQILEKVNFFRGCENDCLASSTDKDEVFVFDSTPFKLLYSLKLQREVI